MGRRSVMGTAAGLGALVLSACNPFAKDLGAACSRAAETVTGVESAHLETGSDGTLRRTLSGPIALAESGDAALPVFDEALRAALTALHDEEGGQEAATRHVGGVLGRPADGTQLTLLDLDGVDASTVDLSAVQARFLFDRYGLT